MDNKSIPFNMEFTFDKDLREKPVDFENMKSGVHYMIEQIESVKDPDAEARLYGEIGVYSRIIGELDDSERFLQTAINLHTLRKNLSSVFINQLRLAHTYQWQREFNKANKLFNELIKKVHDHSRYEPYKDFLYQHYGKCKYDESEFEAAYSLFQVALKIRKEKGDYSLVRSTEVSINRCKEILMLP
ncbi:tetratricopeptide repeat protein [Pseudalkalibacillus sp. R45]|uniref:tetratricopeptide repeat protein n=1 Tax=Pseudalkalibacillus sp. R45 TaxID=3457433 RepID=UPI003FCCA576